MALVLTPIHLKQANEFVTAYHRHHKATVGHKFSIAVSDGNNIVGVAICGRPVSRYLDNGETLEINRCCTDGTKNACSMLYGACGRAAKAMGYKKIITYILASEKGTSLQAAGFIDCGLAGKPEWTGERKPKAPLYPQDMKKRYEKSL